LISKVTQRIFIILGIVILIIDVFYPRLQKLPRGRFLGDIFISEDK